MFSAQGQSDVLDCQCVRDLKNVRSGAVSAGRERRQASREHAGSEHGLHTQAEQYDPHKDLQWKFTVRNYSRSLMPSYAWTSRDRVIIKRMTAYLAGEKQNIFVEMKEMEKHTLSPIDTESIIEVLAWSACDHEERTRFVAVAREKMTLVANMKQSTMMRARQEEECQGLHQDVKHMNEAQGKLLAMMER